MTTAAPVWRYGRCRNGLTVVEERGQASFPPVVIVNPGNQGGQVPNYHQPPALPPALSQGGPRQFRVIGQEDAVIDGQWSED